MNDPYEVFEMNTQAQHMNVHYHEKDLTPACVAGEGQHSYEERKSAREAEVKGLEDAMKFLKDFK